MRIVIFVVMAFLRSRAVMTSAKNDECPDLSSAQANFLFVLDQSSSVDETESGLQAEFNFVLYFLKPLKLRVGANKSAIAVATFNGDFHHYLSFEKSLEKNQTALTELIKGLQEKITANGATNLAKAINQTIDIYIDLQKGLRRRFPKYVLLITDVSEPETEPLKRQPVEGLRFICIIINKSPYDSGLNLCNQVYKRDDFTELQSEIIPQVGTYLARDLCLIPCKHGTCSKFEGGPCRCDDGFELKNGTCLRKSCSPDWCECPCTNGVKSPDLPISVCVCNDHQLENILDDKSVDVDYFTKVALHDEARLEQLFLRGDLFKKLAEKITTKEYSNPEDVKLDVVSVLKMAHVVVGPTNSSIASSSSSNAAAVEDLIGNLKNIGFFLANERNISFANDEKEKRNVQMKVVLSRESIEGSTPMAVFHFPDNSSSSSSPSNGSINLPPTNESIVFIGINRIQRMLKKHPKRCRPSIWGFEDCDQSSVSPLISATIRNSKNKIEKFPSHQNVSVRFFFPFYSSFLALPSCAFLRDENWDTNGCELVNSSPSSSSLSSSRMMMAECVCNHLTSFSILVESHGENALPEDQVIVLDILTKIGCVVSIICLVLSISIFSIFRSLASLRNTIHINLCLNLALGQLLFFLGANSDVFPEEGNYEIACGVIAGAIFFFFLSAFCWMLLEGVELYLKLIHVFETPIRLNRIFFAVGYGVPALFIVIAAPAMPKSFGDGALCWLRGQARLLFVIPVILILLVNFVFFFLSLRVVWRVFDRQTNLNLGGRGGGGRRATNDGGRDSDSTSVPPSRFRKMLFVSAVFASLLGTPWILGMLYQAEARWTIVFAYLFIFFAAFQGLYIFLFNCVLNETVRAEFHRLIWSRRGTYNTGSSQLDASKSPKELTVSTRLNTSALSSH